MDALIHTALTELRLLSFTYKGTIRLVDAHSFGRQANNADALCAWQRAGGSGEDFRFFTVADMRDMALFNETFDGPRLGYRKGDWRFLIIYAEFQRLAVAPQRTRSTSVRTRVGHLKTLAGTP